MKNLNWTKQKLDRIDEVQSQIDHSSTNLKTLETTNLKRNTINFNKSAESFIFVNPLTNIKDIEIITDFSIYGNIIKIYKDENNRYFKIHFDNRDSIVNAIKDCETKLRTGMQNKYKVEEGGEDQKNNLNFRNLIYPKDRNERNLIRDKNRSEFNSINNFSDNIGSAFGSIFFFLN
jgi:hypothetical protein